MVPGEIRSRESPGRFWSCFWVARRPSRRGVIRRLQQSAASDIVLRRLAPDDQPTFRFVAPPQPDAAHDQHQARIFRSLVERERGCSTAARRFLDPANVRLLPVSSACSADQGPGCRGRCSARIDPAPFVQRKSEVGYHLAALLGHHRLSRGPVAASLVPWRCVQADYWTGERRFGTGASKRNWQFLREAWKGIAPLLQDSAQVVIRIGGTRLGEEQLRAGLLESLNSTGHKFRLAESRQTVIKNGQRRIFQPSPDTKASVEHDFRFRLAYVATVALKELFRNTCRAEL
jgi:hypothetical protein